MFVASDESVHVCHKGYLSIFPMLLGLLPPDSPHLGAILDTMRDPEHLWSPYGLRSLSLSHPEFGKGENYWKGPIWIQMNFLALKSLYKVRLIVVCVVTALNWVGMQTYAAEEGPYKQRAQDIYDELRRNIVDNVFKACCSPIFALSVLNTFVLRNTRGLVMYGNSTTPSRARAGEGTSRRASASVPH